MKNQSQEIDFFIRACLFRFVRMSREQRLFSGTGTGFERAEGRLGTRTGDLFGKFLWSCRMWQNVSRNGFSWPWKRGTCGENEWACAGKEGISLCPWLLGLAEIRMAALFSVPTGFGAEYPNLVAVENTKSQYELCSVILSVCVKFVTLHEFIREKTHE